MSEPTELNFYVIHDGVAFFRNLCTQSSYDGMDENQPCTQLSDSRIREQKWIQSMTYTLNLKGERKFTIASVEALTSHDASISIVFTYPADLWSRILTRHYLVWRSPEFVTDQANCEDV